MEARSVNRSEQKKREKNRSQIHDPHARLDCCDASMGGTVHVISLVRLFLDVRLFVIFYLTS
jgi:hypothetical protein